MNLFVLLAAHSYIKSAICNDAKLEFSHLSFTAIPMERYGKVDELELQFWRKLFSCTSITEIWCYLVIISVVVSWLYGFSVVIYSMPCESCKLPHRPCRLSVRPFWRVFLQFKRFLIAHRLEHTLHYFAYRVSLNTYITDRRVGVKCVVAGGRLLVKCGVVICRVSSAG